MDIEQEIEELEESISESKTELSKAEGAKETLMKRLKDDFELKSLKGAEKELVKLEASINKLEDNIVTKIEELKEIYDW